MTARSLSINQYFLLSAVIAAALTCCASSIAHAGWNRHDRRSGIMESLSGKCRGLAHFAKSSEQNVPVPLLQTTFRIGSQPQPNPGRYSETAWWAVPSESPRFSGGYIGGGAVLFGDSRARHEGTWGWDYDGALLPKRIWLNWLHGRRRQDGGGQYEPDGPKILHR